MSLVAAWATNSNFLKLLPNTWRLDGKPCLNLSMLCLAGCPWSIALSLFACWKVLAPLPFDMHRCTLIDGTEDFRERESRYIGAIVSTWFQYQFVMASTELSSSRRQRASTVEAVLVLRLGVALVFHFPGPKQWQCAQS